MSVHLFGLNFSFLFVVFKQLVCNSIFGNVVSFVSFVIYVSVYTFT